MGFGTDYTDGGLMTTREGREFRVARSAYPPASGPEGPLGLGKQLPGPGNIGDNITNFQRAQQAFHLHQQSKRLRRYTLSMDGFVSVEAPLSGGEFLTKRLRFEGHQLAISFSTWAAGSILDGRPIQGFRLEDCQEPYGDRIDHVVHWKAGEDLSSSRANRLRFVLRMLTSLPFNSGRKELRVNLNG